MTLMDPCFDPLLLDPFAACACALRECLDAAAVSLDCEPAQAAAGADACQTD